jgi:hypothetical protein
MAKVKNCPTLEQVDYFFNQVAIYQVRLNLQDWRIEPSGVPAGKGCMADVGIMPEDKLAVISLGKDWGNYPINEKTLASTAMHELLHVFLRPLVDSARSRDESAIDGAEHSIVVLLEKLLA